jgi:hypothetical protein
LFGALANIKFVHSVPTNQSINRSIEHPKSNKLWMSRGLTHCTHSRQFGGPEDGAAAADRARVHFARWRYLVLKLYETWMEEGSQCNRRASVSRFHHMHGCWGA